MPGWSMVKNAGVEMLSISLSWSPNRPAVPLVQVSGCSHSILLPADFKLFMKAIRRKSVEAATS